MWTFLVCTLLFWTVVPFVVPLLICLYIYRAWVILLQKIVHPDWIGILSPRDMVVWEDMGKPPLNSVMTNVQVLRGEADVEKFQNEFMDRVISYRNPRGEYSYAKFEHYFENWMGFPFWKKERNFDIKQHIRLLTPDDATDSGSDQVKFEFSEVMTEEQVVKIVADLTTRPFPEKMSPWEFLIIPNYQPKDGQPLDSQGREVPVFAAIFRNMHVLFDGFSYNTLLIDRICGQTTIKTKQTQSAPIVLKSREIFRRLRRFLEILLNLGMYHARFFILDRDVNIWHGKGNKKMTKTLHMVKCDGVPFSVIKSVSKKLGVAATATIFSCLAGGIRRYFEMQQEEIPEKMTAFFPWPVDNHPMDGLVNHWSFVDMFLLLGEKDCIKRINETNVHFQALKNSPLPEIMWNFSPLFSAVPTPFFNFWGWNRKATINLTNFPGASLSVENPLLFFNKWELVDDIVFLAKLRGNPAVQFSMMTDRTNINVTVTADRGMLTEEGAKQLARCIEDEFRELESLS